MPFCYLSESYLSCKRVSAPYNVLLKFKANSYFSTQFYHVLNRSNVLCIFATNAYFVGKKDGINV